MTIILQQISVNITGIAVSSLTGCHLSEHDIISYGFDLVVMVN